MDLDYTHTYAADPERVVGLLRNEDFIADVAVHAGATEHSVDITPDATTLIMSLPVPATIAKFIGSSMKLKQVFRFGDVAADGSVRGTVDVDVPGMPVDVTADAEMLPQGDGTTQGRYTGDLKVKIPLVGKKVEAQVEPYIRDAFAGLERRAADWLSR
ncbi:DUF2505 domain-containing protein [Tessaracoccus sp. MC1756]|uniref:DUF2505 domain-containing protein n=1 Tax=Tessaracoccus sp. MC1756 TaxID=2760311 RepID=UPI0016004AEE|nr:DUF2505 domain-containing protein [Tessaracoccus sp. MC1756]MBB1509155.1 DUF2505 domain-containing protein [Tessaracoccus sp. MC1756]